MKNLFLFLIIFSSLSFTSKYDKILEGLSNNYVLLLGDEIDKDLFLEYFEISEEKYVKDLREYEKAINAFYSTDKGILKYLLSYEGDLQICKWIKTKNPYSSTVTENDLITNEKGALILFDNYLINTSSIRIPEYINKLSYQKLKSFYSKNENLSKSELKKEYEKWIRY